MTSYDPSEPVLEAICDFMDARTVGSLHNLAHVCVRTLSELENAHEGQRRLENEADPMPMPTGGVTEEWRQRFVAWTERKRQRDRKWEERLVVGVDQEPDGRSQLDSLLFELH